MRTARIAVPLFACVLLLFGAGAVCPCTAAQTINTKNTNLKVVLLRPGNTPGLILEYERAIYVMHQGIEKGWTTRSQFLNAFDKANRRGTSGEILTSEWRVVRSDLARSLPSDTHQIWDEHPPYTVAVQEQSVQLLEIPLSVLLAKDAVAAQKSPK